MTVVFSDYAIDDLKKLDGNVKRIFIRAAETLDDLPPRRHLKHGLPFLIKEVGQGRIVYDLENGEIQILRCFSTHAKYEKWYKSYHS